MVSCSAISIDGTLTGINTFEVVAPQCSGTVRISKTFIGLTVVVRVTLVVFKARTNTSVCLGTANGIGATLCVQARVLAVPVITGFYQFTLWISLTTS